MGDSFANKALSRSSPPADTYFRSLSPESTVSSIPIKSEARNTSAEIARPVSESESEPGSESETLQNQGAVVIVDDTEEEEEEEDDGDVGELDSIRSNPKDPSGKGQALPLRAGSNNTNDSSFLGTRTKSAQPSRKHKTASREGSNSNMIQDTPKQTSGQRRTSFEDNDSELSEPDSDVQSQIEGVLAELDDEIVVNAKANVHSDPSPQPVASEKEDETMADVEDQDQSPRSHYPKRKRITRYSDLTLAEMVDGRAPTGPAAKIRASRQTMASLKGVLLGRWRDSTVPDAENRHAVIGFIDSRERLRTRIQRSNVKGDPSSVEHPLPPGPGGSWVTLDRIVFFQHLVGLNHVQVKEYVKLRADASESSDEERQAAEAAAVKEAIHRAKADPLSDNIVNPLSVAHGEELPDTITSTGRSASKRRRVNGGAAAMAQANGNPDSAEPSTRLASRPLLQARLHPGLSMHGALHGTRPTRILLGYWKGSSEPNPEDRHAVHGILGHNDMFRVKVTRSTRDGRFVGGNFPSGAGALWIQYEEVEFEPHLKPLSRFEVKEYCRIRQYQLDHGETPPDRIANETKAVYEAQARVACGAHKHDKYAPHRAISNSPPIASETEATNAAEMATEDEAGTRQTRRNEKRKRRFSQTQQRPSLSAAETAKPRGAKDETRVQSSESRSSSRTHAESLEKANALARKEIARVEAAQGRMDRHAYQRERAAVMAADAAAAAAAAAASSPCPPGFAANGRASLLHESDEMQRLNKVWAAQESIRMKAGSEDAKIYDGIKYERKANGPFVGKLVSQGTIINIDGEDYVEYRVLTKPSFF